MEADLLLLYIGPAGDLQNLHMYTDSLAFERLVYFYFESSVSVIALLLKFNCIPDLRVTKPARY